MTKAEALIIESIAALPDAERQRLVKLLIEMNLDGPSVFATLSPEQRHHIQQGIAQAERGEFSSVDEFYAELEQQFRARAR
jgi:hypothetical protein